MKYPLATYACASSSPNPRRRLGSSLAIRGSARFTTDVSRKTIPEPRITASIVPRFWVLVIEATPANRAGKGSIPSFPKRSGSGLRRDRHRSRRGGRGRRLPRGGAERQGCRGGAGPGRGAVQLLGVH